MENKYITVAYKLYAMIDGEKELIEEAPAEHPFQFITGIGYTLERFEKEITALAKGDNFNFTIPCAEAYGEVDPEGIKTLQRLFLNLHSAVLTASLTKTTCSKETSSC